MKNTKKFIVLGLIVSLLFSFTSFTQVKAYSIEEEDKMEKIKQEENLKCFNNLRDYYEITYGNKYGRYNMKKFSYRITRYFWNSRNKVLQNRKEVYKEVFYNRLKEKENKDEYNDNLKIKFVYIKILEGLDKGFGYNNSFIKDFETTNYCKILADNKYLATQIALKKIDYNIKEIQRRKYSTRNNIAWLDIRGRGLDKTLNIPMVESFVTKNYLEYNKIEKKFLELTGGNELWKFMVKHLMDNKENAEKKLAQNYVKLYYQALKTIYGLEKNFGSWFKIGSKVVSNGLKVWENLNNNEIMQKRTIILRTTAKEFVDIERYFNLGKLYDNRNLKDYIKAIYYTTIMFWYEDYTEEELWKISFKIYIINYYSKFKSYQRFLYPLY